MSWLWRKLDIHFAHGSVILQFLISVAHISCDYIFNFDLVGFLGTTFTWLTTVMTTFEQGPALWKVGYLRFASRPVSISSSLSSSLSSSSVPCIYKRKQSWKTSEAPLLKGTYIRNQTSMWGNQRISKVEHILREKEVNRTFKFRTGISSSSSSSSSDSPDKNVQNCMYFSENLVHHLNYDWSVVEIVMIFNSWCLRKYVPESSLTLIGILARGPRPWAPFLAILAPQFLTQSRRIVWETRIWAAALNSSSR